VSLLRFAASWPAISRQPTAELEGSEPEKPNDIKSLIDLKNLKVV
jgi:hypothetical protein